MQVTGIGWVGILTDDFESTLRFFSDVLRLPIVYRDEKKELVHFRFQTGQLLEVYGPSNRQRKEKYRWFNGPVLGFEVDDIELARREMTNRGARFITELESWEDDMWTLFLGPENMLFEILQPARRPASHFGSVLGICGAKIFVQNFAGAMQFFTQVMEMSLIRQDDGQEVAFCRLPTGDLFEIFGSCEKTGDQIPPASVGFEVEDMAEAHREMESRGLELIGPSEVMDDGSVRSQFRAPDDFIYELIYDPRCPSG